MKYILLLILFNIHCSIKPPAITFTQSKTSVEKQIIGEEIYLEKDGWLISSVRTSSSGSDIWRKDGQILSDNNKYQKSLYAILYLSEDLSLLKKKGIVGETRLGIIEMNPLMKKEYMSFTLTEKTKVRKLISIVNKSRKEIYSIRMKKAEQENINPRKLRKLKKQLMLMYFAGSEKNEFVKMENGEWKRK